jgi:hypothetical protein
MGDLTGTETGTFTTSGSQTDNKVVSAAGSRELALSLRSEIEPIRKDGILSNTSGNTRYCYPLRYWLQDGSNFVQISMRVADDKVVEDRFSSAPASSVVDPDLVKAIAKLNVGQGLFLPKKQIASERSFKVRVNKAAKAAMRELEWNEEDEKEYLVRVKQIIQPSANGTANGTVQANTEEKKEPATAGTATTANKSQS